MKKISLTVFSLFCAILVFASTTNNGNPTKPTYFSDDMNSITAEFADLSALEDEVAQTGMTMSELEAAGSTRLHALRSDADVAAAIKGLAAPGDEKALGIPGFVWGFCFGLLGVVLVYVVIEDDASKKSQGKQSLIGCAVGSAVSLLLWFLVFASQLE